jgi:hypothetical protein
LPKGNWDALPPGSTTPPEIRSLKASSTLMLKGIVSSSGNTRKNPEVGFGVVGRKILSISAPICSRISPDVCAVTNAKE